MDETTPAADPEDPKSKRKGCGCLLPFLGIGALIAMVVIVSGQQERREQERLHRDDAVAAVRDVMIDDPEGRFTVGEVRLENNGGEGRVTVVMHDSRESNRSPLAEAQLEYAADSTFANFETVCEARRSYFWSTGGEVDMVCPSLILAPDEVVRVVVRP